jgi:hypothetical protein
MLYRGNKEHCTASVRQCEASTGNTMGWDEAERWGVKAGECADHVGRERWCTALLGECADGGAPGHTR